MLILCSECGKEFSNKAKTCPNCGCPIEEIDNSMTCIVNNKTYNFSDVIIELNNYNYTLDDIEIVLISNIIRLKTLLTWNESKKLLNIILKTKQIPDKFDGETQELPNRDNSLHCPKCNSTSITTGARGVTFTTGFFGASKTVNRCGSCGHTWSPKR